MPFAMGNARLERRESVGVEMRGFEPLTSAVQRQRSSS